MAVLKIIGVGEESKYHDDQAIANVIHYIGCDGAAATRLAGGIAVYPPNAIYEMELLSAAYGKQSGARLRHFVLSLSPEERLSVERMQILAWDVASYYGARYQIVWGIHEEKKHKHIHFAMNRVSYIDGKKYPGDKKDYYDFIKHVKQSLSKFWPNPWLEVKW